MHVKHVVHNKAINPLKTKDLPKGRTAPPLFYGVFHLFCKSANKMTLSVSAYVALGAYRAFSCDSDVTPDF